MGQILDRKTIFMSKIINILICMLIASVSWAQTTLHQWTFDSVSTSIGTTRPAVGNGSVSLLGGTTAVVPPSRETEPLPTAGRVVPIEVDTESKVHWCRVVWAHETLAISMQIRMLMILDIKIVLRSKI